jgi:hypothetical protein
VKFKIAVAGTITRDTIHLHGGKVIEGYGGILYNLIALSRLFGSEATIHPVCNLGHDIGDHVMLELGRYRSLRLDQIWKVGTRNNHVSLFYDKRGEKSEILKNRVPLLSFERMRKVLDSDFILVNFISGFDLTLSTLKRIFSGRKGKLLIDLHSLTLGIERSGRRFLRRPPRWREYVRSCDYLQLNRRELEVVTGGGSLRIDEFSPRLHDLNRLGPEGVVVTLGRRGALASFREGSKIRKRRFQPYRPSEEIDTTGCGDVFSAAFIHGYLKGREFFEAVEFANRAAGFKAGFSGVEGLRHLGRLK